MTKSVIAFLVVGSVVIVGFGLKSSHTNEGITLKTSLGSDGISSTLDTILVFKSENGVDVTMSVFLPEDYSESDRTYPALVFFHGGSWNAGEANWHYPDCAYWSSRGVIAASVDYRLKDRDNVEVPLECVKDAKSSIRFLRLHAEKYKIDPNKIIAGGASAGGLLAIGAATLHEEYTNDDAFDLAISCIPNAVMLQNPAIRSELELTPLSRIREGLPPTITFIGDQDPGIPWQSMLDFHSVLKESKNESRLHVAKGAKHGFCNGRNPKNKYFYWHLELADKFLVENGILTGASKVKVPKEVHVMGENDYFSYY